MKWFFIVMGAGAVTLALICSIAQNSAEHKAEMKKLQGECKVVGDAYDDEGDQGGSMRIMYQCPDGMFHIR